MTRGAERKCEACSDPECTGPTASPCDPHWDGTDGACPAWWRGQDVGVDGACMRVEEALAGDARGTCSKRLQAVRERVAELVRRAGTADEIQRHLTAACAHVDKLELDLKLAIERADRAENVKVKAFSRMEI